MDTENGAIKQLYWYIYSDQLAWVEKKTSYGLTKAEIYRRIVDFAKVNQVGNYQR